MATPRISFDECFQSFPPINTPHDLKEVWQKALLDLKKIPVDPKTKLLIKKSLGRETQMEVAFQSAGGINIKGHLTIPRRRGKIPTVILLHDYHEESFRYKEFTDSGIAQLSLRLRFHLSDEQQSLESRQTKTISSKKSDAAKQPNPSENRLVANFFRQSDMTQLSNSFPFRCYLDAVRAIDFLRLQKGIAVSNIGILGRGLGAAMGLFAAAMRPDNISVLALERPSFAWMNRWLIDAKSSYAEEVRLCMAGSARGAKNKVKKSLDYLDILNWSESIRCPLLVSIGLADTQNPPRSGFALFNHIRSDKSMEFYPDESRLEFQKRDERKKSINYLIKRLNNDDDPDSDIE